MCIIFWKFGRAREYSILYTIQRRMKTSSSITAEGGYISSFLQNTLKTNQVEINTDSRTLRPIAKLKEPRDLFALPKGLDCPQQAARWPAECQVLEERVHHIDTVVSGPEYYYQSTGNEVQPKPVGEESGQVVFQYYPVSAVNYFSRSSVGGSKYFLEACPCSDKVEGLRFESRFESGNLAKVVKITDSYYELYLRTDMYTNRHMQWFYFRVENMKTDTLYRFSLVNLSKGDSLYSVGMRPLLYSVKDAQLNDIGWRRCGNNIAYYKNECQGEEDQQPSYTLTFTLDFPHNDDRVYLAHCYPYTYTDLQDYLIRLQNHPIKSTYSKLRLLCRSLAGNNVYYLTITAPSLQDEPKKKRAIVVTARVHPGETPASWMMKGFMDFLTGDSLQARELRDKFIFKLVPMLNPDGVIVGNNRCSLTGRDLNRQYRTVIRETYPSVWHTKVMIRRLMEECGIEMYCDLHAHSRKHNIFIYGCENRRSPDRRLQEQVFPLMLHKNTADKFCFESCKFRIQRCKEGTGRVVVWMMGVANSYTMEASFGGSDLGSRAGTHFNTHDYEQMGRHFCETLLDFCDQDPSKERLRSKIVSRLELEGSNADEPTNINLSDYSSDEGDTSSTSEEESPIEIVYCPAPNVPPPSPVLPRREHKRSQTAKERSPQMVQKRSVLPVHCTNIDLAKDSSDFNDAGTETDSGDESPTWKHTSRCTKSETSPTRGIGSSKCTVGDMPPELIVQAVGAPEGEKNNEFVAEPITKENKETQTTQKEKPKKHCKRTANRLNNQQSGKVLPKTTTSLRKRVWTGIPCTCHDHIVATHWSSRGGGEISVLRACSQKLAGLKKLKDPAHRIKKGTQKLKHQTKCTSDSSGGEERKKHAPLPSPKYRSVQRSPLRKPRKITSSESSSEEQHTDLNEVKKLLQKKQKLQRWKTLSKLNAIKQTRDLTLRESANKLHRQSKPSLKWKFCKKSLILDRTEITAVQNENDSDALNVSASCSETDNKPVESQVTETELANIPPPKASNVNTKKKKIRKHKGILKKFQCVASVSSAAAGFAKNATKGKKSSKTS